MFRRIIDLLLNIVYLVGSSFGAFRFVKGTKDHNNKLTIRHWFDHKVVDGSGSRQAYWPVHPASKVISSRKIYSGVDTCPGMMPGCYIQGIGGIKFGDHILIAPNVGVISSNHALGDGREHVDGLVTIGSYSWLGFGCVILPGVTLGEFTVVGAGAVVTKSFPEGHCVIAGNPAHKIKDLPTEECVRYSVKERYYGYLNEREFLEYRSKYLLV